MRKPPQLRGSGRPGIPALLWRRSCVPDAWSPGEPWTRVLIPRRKAMLNRSKLRFLMLAPAALMSLLAVGPAHAARSSRFELTSDGRLVDVQVLVGDNATPL